jgi:hypothetical protein
MPSTVGRTNNPCQKWALVATGNHVGAFFTPVRMNPARGYRWAALTIPAFLAGLVQARSDRVWPCGGSAPVLDRRTGWRAPVRGCGPEQVWLPAEHAGANRALTAAVRVVQITADLPPAQRR